MTAVVRVCIGGNADDIGDTCACWLERSPARYEASWSPAFRLGAVLALGVAGVPEDDGTLPMNHDGTHPRSPDSSLTAWETNVSFFHRVDRVQHSRMTNGYIA